MKDVPIAVWLSADDDAPEYIVGERSQDTGLVEKIVAHDEGLAIYCEGGFGVFLPWHRVAEVDFKYTTPGV